VSGSFLKNVEIQNQFSCTVLYMFVLCFVCSVLYLWCFASVNFKQAATYGAMIWTT